MDEKCIVFMTAEFSRKHSRTLRGPCDTILDRNCVMQVVFRFCKVHETSRTLKVTCGARQGQEEACTFLKDIYIEREREREMRQTTREPRSNQQVYSALHHVVTLRLLGIAGPALGH